MARSEPLFTIVTINLDNAAGLDETIRSVTAQGFSDKEYIVIDGGSTDASPDVIGTHASEIDRILNGPDRGIYDAMNKGVALSRGEWVLFLNSGDMFEAPDVLERVAGAAVSSDADILLGDVMVLYPDGTRRLQKAVPPEEIPYGMICSHQSMLVRRSLLLSLPFTVGRMRSDYELTLRAWRLGRRFRLLGFAVAKVTAGGWSDRSRLQSLRERWVLLREAGAFSAKLLPHFGSAVFFAVLAPIAKMLLPSRAISAIRKFKARYLSARSFRG